MADPEKLPKVILQLIITKLAAANSILRIAR